MRYDPARAMTPTVRYHDAHQLSSIAVSFRMAFLRRLLLVGLLAFFAASGASACEHAQRGVALSTVTLVAHPVARASDRCGVTEHASPYGGCTGHMNGCAASCCVHCGAPPVGTRIGTGVPGRSPRFALASALRAGITHAPPLPPPIV